VRTAAAASVARTTLRVLALALAGLVVLAATYLVLTLVLGAIPQNRGFVASADGVPIYVRTNGIHADLVVPTRHGDVNWSDEFPVQHMGGLPAPTEWIAFGWGDRGFLLTTPTWADLRATTALLAITGLGRGAMHVEYIESPAAYKVRRVRVSETEYQRLVSFIRASFERDAGGKVRRIDAPGYIQADAFYEAVESYTFWHTCNEWTRRALAHAGVRTAVWAPLDAAIFYHLPEPKAGQR